ncbi:DUF882 domain-containing protein [Methylocapsa aurea]|uniref:DUF882 domain-containing protein n=1 Tax=Methylocapsa aurea TaxID=663610 RepID=UPI00138E4A5E|nr:DUF882 domain-containing protein [Methylocapsa aurea]
MRQPRPRTAPERSACLAAAYVGAMLFGFLAPSSTETAVANGDTRTLSLHHSHTGESIEATFRVNGSYDPAVLEKLNWFLRDWRNDDRARMDPRLFDVIWEVYRTAGASEPIVIVSAYRSPATNAMLRRRSSAVAEHSQHILGKAMDTTMPGMSMERIREIGMRLQRGGVGYYGSSNFVHLDVGNVRHWPRMGYDQLARLFPDGKTVHLASNGRTLARYEEARAEIASRGGVTSDAPAPQSGNFFAWLFGKQEDDDESEAVRAAPPSRRDRFQVAALTGTGAPSTKSSAFADRRERRQAPAPQPVPSAANAPGSEPDQEPAVAGTVVASLAPTPVPRDRRSAIEDSEAAAGGPAKDRAEKGSASVAPLPPPRPLELVAYADVPMPPARPEGLTRVASNMAGKPASKSDVIGALSAAPGANAPQALVRAANLPVLITQGAKDQAAIPAEVLAYAPSAQQAQRPRGAPLGKETGQSSQAAVVPARLDRSSFHGLASDVATANAPAPSLLGQALTGLRQAARILPDALSGLPSAGFASAFRAAASDLDCSRFVSAAPVKPAPAADSVSIAEHPGRARGN